MANPNTTATPTTTPEAPKAKKEKKVYQEVFPTAEAAEKEAAGRTKGPRSAFKCEQGGKTFYVVHNNAGRAGGVAFAQIGGTVTEIGKAPKAPKQLGVDAIQAAILGLPEAEKAAVLAQLKSVLGKK